MAAAISQQTTPSAAIAASAEHGTKVYGSGAATIRALDDVSIDLYAGQFTAVMGPSGSGKSTLLHCLAGLDSLTTGRVTVGGRDLGSLSDRERTILRRERLGFVFQTFNLVRTLTVEENIILPLALAGRTPDTEWFDMIVRTVMLGDRLTHRPSELSGGQQQRVAVARALVTRPEVVFADEPTGNLDSRAGGEILQFLRDAVDRTGQTTVMVTHDPVDAAHADRVVFLADGALVDELAGPTPQAITDRLLHLGS